MAVLIDPDFWLVVALGGTLGLWGGLSVGHRRIRFALALAIGWGVAGAVYSL